MKQVLIRNLEDFKSFVQSFSESVKEQTVIMLTGPMGAGKTEFVKNFCNIYGLNAISSPTFAIHNHYKTTTVNIHHFDLHRLKNEDELESTGFWDFFAENNSIIFIEWPENLHGIDIPHNWRSIHITIKVLEDNQRLICLN